jgi:choline-glycine betaine transporter
MKDQIFGIIIISFIVLAIMFLVFSKKFRKSVSHHITDWMAKKVSRVIIFVIFVILVLFFLSIYGSK